MINVFLLTTEVSERHAFSKCVLQLCSSTMTQHPYEPQEPS